MARKVHHVIPASEDWKVPHDGRTLITQTNKSMAPSRPKRLREGESAKPGRGLIAGRRSRPSTLRDDPFPPPG